MLPTIVYIAPYLLGILWLISLIGAYVNFRQARRAPYFRLRRDASRRGWRWTLMLVLTTGGIGGAMTARQFVPPPEFNFRPSLLFASPTPAPTLALVLPPTITPNPSLTPRSPFEGPPTITPTQPTPTTTPTPLIATVASSVTPPPDASLRITAISSGISADLRPVNTGTTFPAGTARIYFWLEFENMVDGVSWSQVLLLNGSVIRSESQEWDRGAEGSAYYWFGAQGGWPAGNYEVQFYVGDKLMATASFTIVD
ncbi:MAG TPA: hypothetical protein ENI95_10765 [Chloroflexi bacterium]|nr:hypothetical protein [Chloroflexota bacterium]